MIQERVSVDAIKNAVKVELGRDFAVTFAPMNERERVKWTRKMARKIKTNREKVLELAYYHHA